MKPQTLELKVLKEAIRKKLPKAIVKEVYNNYNESYEEMDKDVEDKIRFREITQKYWDYMYFSGRKG